MGRQPQYVILVFSILMLAYSQSMETMKSNNVVTRNLDSPIFPEDSACPLINSTCTFEHNGFCYSYIDGIQASYGDAEAICNSMNGNLATVRDQIVQKSIKKFTPLYKYAWIGLRRICNDCHKNYYWIGEGTKDYHYTNWDSNEPATNGDYCCVLIDYYSYQWITYLCDYATNFWCSRSNSRLHDEMTTMNDGN